MPSDVLLNEAYEWARAACDDDREAVALELLSAYVPHRPDHGHAWYLLGDCLRVVGLLHEAERALLRALALAPDYAKWSIEARIGQLQADAGNHDVAEQWFRRAVDSKEARNTGWVWLLRGTNLASQCQLEAAEQCHRSATALNDDVQDEAWLNLGYVLRAQGRYVEAAMAFEQALSISPEDPEATTALRGLRDIDAAVQLVGKLQH